MTASRVISLFICRIVTVSFAASAGTVSKHVAASTPALATAAVRLVGRLVIGQPPLPQVQDLLRELGGTL
jgi:hypothetical protein